MGDLKFVPQSMLDVWADLGKIELEGTTLKIPAEGAEFELTPALRFVTLLEGDDLHKLVAKVKTTAFVKELGGETLDDSCLVGDTAYQVQPGFLAETHALAAAQVAKATRKLTRPQSPTQPPAAPVPATIQSPRSPGSSEAPASPQPSTDDPAQDPQKDADLLSRFLLQHLD